MRIDYNSIDKNEWSICQLSDIYDITIGRTPPRKEFEWFSEDCNDVPWVSISDMGSDCYYLHHTREYLTRAAVDTFNIRLVPENTLLLSFKLTLGRVSITNVPSCTNEAIAHLVTDNENLLEFMYCQLKQYDYDALGNTSSIGTAVNSKTIKAMKILMPDFETLMAFHNKSGPVLQAIRNNEREIRRLVELRDYLLPKLMSGEIDVSNLELDSIS